MSARILSLCCSAAVFASLVGCGGDGSENLATVSTDVCSTGLQWQGGDHGSEFMHPGRDCIECHTRRKEGPEFIFAGTVQATLNEPDECAGVEGVAVRITDANQKTFTVTTNRAGNFFLRKSDAAGFAFPFKAAISYQGKEAAMATPQSSGACASCHTFEGKEGAPGRIQVP